MSKDLTKMTNEEIATQIMSIKHATATLDNQLKALVGELVNRDCAGTDVPTISGENVISLTSGFEHKLNMEKATSVFGAEFVGQALVVKQQGVKLTLSDFGKLINSQNKDAVCDIVPATVKATVKKA